MARWRTDSVLFSSESEMCVFGMLRNEMVQELVPSCDKLKVSGVAIDNGLLPRGRVAEVIARTKIWSEFPLLDARNGY